MAKLLRYALVGTGVRAIMYRDALQGPHAAHGRLVAICDTNTVRMRAWQSGQTEQLPMYAADSFSEMLRKEEVDRVIVCSVDSSHHHYICAAMDAGCDVISEKPMTTDETKCRQIQDAIRRTGRDLRVTFNYRYSPRNAKIKELLAAGVIGRVHSVHFEWMLDTQHGADYFRRWHRDKANSGGLLVHKSTHHFDLMNWWLDSVPESVFARGGLKFYGRKNARARGMTSFYERSLELADPGADPFAMDLKKSERMRRLYLEAEGEDGYFRDRSVFSEGITAEDDISALVQYRSGATMTYHLTAYAPWEGYRVSFTGEGGRLEIEVVERASTGVRDCEVNLARNVIGRALEPVTEPVSIIVRPHWSVPRKVDFASTHEGGHGGGDRLMLAELFGGGDAAATPTAATPPLNQSAGFSAGAYSVLCGVAGNRSMATGLPVHVADLLPGLDAG